MRNSKTHLCMVLLFAICVIPSAAFAILIPFTSDGKSLISDTETGDVWIKDMARFEDKTYAQVGLTIDRLNQRGYGGVNSWELATLEQVEKLFVSITTWAHYDLFGITYEDWGKHDEYGSWGITSTTFINDDGDEVYYAPWLARWPNSSSVDKDIGWKYYSDGLADPDIGAWVKTTNYPIPEPMTLFLLGSGMIAVATVRRRFWRT